MRGALMALIWALTAGLFFTGIVFGRLFSLIS
jgi:hypothetical protein